MAAYSRTASALAGAAAMSATVLLQTPSSRAAWGWKMEVPTILGFTCQEGTEIGCASRTIPDSCPESNFTCTVVADSGSCDVATITLECAACDTDSDRAYSTIGSACVNTPYHTGVAVNSYLKWSQVPACNGSTPQVTADKSLCPAPTTTADDHTTDHEDHDHGTTTNSQVSGAAGAKACAVLLPAAAAVMGA